MKAHLYQFWSTTFDQNFYGGHFCNFDHGHDLVTILIKVLPLIKIFWRQFTFQQTEAKNDLFLHHIVFSPSVSKFFLHYIVRKSVFELFLHCILTPDLYFPLHQTHLLLAVTNFWWCIARAWCAPKLFLISNQLLLNFQAPNICLLPLTTTNFTLLNSMFCVYLHILCVCIYRMCVFNVYLFPHHYISLSLSLH